MVNLSSLPSQCQDIIVQLANNGTSRNIHTTIAISKAIADHIHLPTSKVTDAMHFYNNAIAMNVYAVISKINELVVIDCDSIKEYVCKMYLWRYRIAFDPPANILMADPETVIDDLFGFNLLFDKSMACQLKDNPSHVMRVYNRFRGVLLALEA